MLCSHQPQPPPPSDLPGMIHHVFVGESIALEGGQPNEMHLEVSNSCERGRPIDSNCLEGGLAIDQGVGPTSSFRPSLTFPTLSYIYKRAQGSRTSELTQRQYSALPTPPSADVLTLQEVLSTMLKRLLPPYPCIGHHSPPSPSAVSFQCAPFRKPINRSPPWPSKGPACRCIW